MAHITFLLYGRHTDVYASDILISGEVETYWANVT